MPLFHKMFWNAYSLLRRVPTESVGVLNLLQWVKEEVM